MKTPTSSRSQGFTLIELLVVISIIGILAALLFPSISSAMMRGKMTQQLNNGRNIYNAMAIYASSPDKDEFPAYTDPDDPATLVTTSNGAFEILLKGGSIDDKKVFVNQGSAWCTKVVQTTATAKQVQAGENDWVYLVGVKWSSKDSRWPLLANAFAPGSTNYVKDASQQGGVWKGSKAIVIYAGGNAENVDTKDTGGASGDSGRYFVPRRDAPTTDAFVKDADWLAGDQVSLVYPLPPSR